MLPATAGRHSSCLGRDDLIGRLSGDEFAILLPAADDTKARATVQAIRERLAASPAPDLGRAVSASFGIATTADMPASLSQLLQAADQAMYVEKRARRKPGGAPPA